MCHTPKEHRLGANLPVLGCEPISGSTTIVYDARPLWCQTYGYLPGLCWYRINTVWWQRHMYVCENNLPGLHTMAQCNTNPDSVEWPGFEPATCPAPWPLGHRATPHQGKVRLMPHTLAQIMCSAHFVISYVKSEWASALCSKMWGSSSSVPLHLLCLCGH